MQQAGHVPHVFTIKLFPASVCPVKKMPQIRKCEVTFTYNPVNHDELQLNVGEIIEIIREVASHATLSDLKYILLIGNLVFLFFLVMYVVYF